MAPGIDIKTIVLNSEYENNWSRFVETLAQLLGHGLDDREISEHFAEQSVMWEGRITKLALSRALSQAIDLGMDTPRVDVPDGRFVRANHIVLQFRDDVPADWHSCNVGDVVKFSASFKGNQGVQPAIGLSELGDEGLVSLRLGLRNGTLLEVVQN